MKPFQNTDIDKLICNKLSGEIEPKLKNKMRKKQSKTNQI